MAKFRTEPDPVLCKTRRILDKDAYWCLCAPFSCAFQKTLGNSFLCKHPDRSEFAQGSDDRSEQQ